MKSHWIKADGTGEIHDTPGEPVWNEMKEFIDADMLELVSVEYLNKRCHMLVDETGLLKNLPINAWATDIYHNAVVKRDCAEKGKTYNPYEYAQIHGAVVLLEGQLK